MNSIPEPELQLYEYSIIRYMPDVERGEFVNVGLLMMCKRQGWIQCRLYTDSPRLDTYCTPATKKTLMAQLQAFELIARAHPDAGAISALEACERFRWLTAVRSAAIRTSTPHPGQTADLDSTFDCLFERLVK